MFHNAASIGRTDIGHGIPNMRTAHFSFHRTVVRLHAGQKKYRRSRALRLERLEHESGHFSQDALKLYLRMTVTLPNLESDVLTKAKCQFWSPAL